MKTTYRTSILTLLVVSLVVIPQPQRVSAQQTKVDRVVDGETIIFTDGTYGSLYGVDAPDITTKTCLSKKSKKRLTKLVEGKKVAIQAASATVDQFGRMPVYLYRKKKLINAVQLRHGLAEVSLPGAAVSSTEKKLYSAQEQAKGKQRGIWSMCTQEQKLTGNIGTLDVRLRFANSVLDRGDKTTVAITTEPNARCSVSVDYLVDEIQSDMGPKTADGEGNIDFIWRTPPAIDPGVWPYTVQCTSGNQKGEYRDALQIFIPH